MKNSKTKQIRPMGTLLLEAEKLIDEAIDSHDVQWGDILHWIYGHLMIHRPDARETYVDDGSHPEFKYGVK